jgi:hypothetical protein
MDCHRIQLEFGVGSQQMEIAQNIVDRQYDLLEWMGLLV